EGLAVIASRLGVRCASEVLGICRIYKASLDAHRAQRVLEKIPSATIDICRTDEIVTRVTDVLDRDQRCGLARGEGKRCDAALKGRNPFLKHRLSRVHDAGIDITQLLECEQVCGMLCRVKLIGCGLVNRYGHGRGCRVCAIRAGMQNHCFWILTLRWHNDPFLL